MSQTQLLIAGLTAAIILIAPLAVLVVAMCKPANRARLAAAPWTSLLFLVLVSVGAWAWLLLAHVEVGARVNGLEDFLRALVALIAIYVVWAVAPVAALTLVVLRLRRPRPALLHQQVESVKGDESATD